MMPPAQMRTTPGWQSGGGSEDTKWLGKAEKHYISQAIVAMAEHSAAPHTAALARITEPMNGELPSTILALLEALDAAEAAAIDEREAGAE